MSIRPKTLQRDLAIVERLKAMASARVIAEEFGLTFSTAESICKRLRREHGIQTDGRRKGGTSCGERDAAVLQRIKEGAGTAQIAKEFNLSAEYSTHLCRRIRIANNMERKVNTAYSQRLEARNAIIVERLKAGANAGMIASEFDMDGPSATNLCALLRRKHGISHQHIKGHKPRPAHIDKEHRAAYSECRKVMGVAFLESLVGPMRGPLDDGQALEILRLHAALRVVTLDAEEYVAVVERRLRQRQREQLDELAQRSCQ